MNRSRTYGVLRARFLHGAFAATLFGIAGAGLSACLSVECAPSDPACSPLTSLILYDAGFVSPAGAFVCVAEASGFAGGDGSAANPYQICDVDMLQLAGADLTASYRLLRDIDATATSEWNGGAGFVPIGNVTTRFSGEFDGAYFAIDGLTINRPAEGSVGLFGGVEGGVVQRLRLRNVAVTGASSVGGIAGSVTANGVVSQVAVYSGTIQAVASAGGVAGFVSSGGQLRECYAGLSISASDTGPNPNTGGITGLIQDSASRMDNCFSRAHLDVPAATFKVGGVIGHFWDVGGCAVPDNVRNVYAASTFNTTSSNHGLFGNLQLCDAGYSYCLDTTDQSGVCQIGTGVNTGGGSRTATSLQCATGPDSTCGGPLTYETWSATIWNFGDATQRPWLQWMGAPP